MEIKSADFIISNTDVKNCPEVSLPEYAFIGRSNVGKSSLINMLTSRKDLAKTSQKPGKTLLINHFLVNNEWYIADLPGYGYAKINLKVRKQLKAMINNYILNRQQLTTLFILIDCRHEPLKIDIDFINSIGEKGVPFSIVFTKADKITKEKLKYKIQDYKNKLSENWEELPPIFSTSAETRKGRDELLQYIEEINNSLK